MPRVMQAGIQCKRRHEQRRTTAAVHCCALLVACGWPAGRRLVGGGGGGGGVVACSEAHPTRRSPVQRGTLHMLQHPTTCCNMLRHAATSRRANQKAPFCAHAYSSACSMLRRAARWRQPCVMRSNGALSPPTAACRRSPARAAPMLALVPAAPRRVEHATDMQGATYDSSPAKPDGSPKARAAPAFVRPCGRASARIPPGRTAVVPYALLATWVLVHVKPVLAVGVRTASSARSVATLI